MFYFKGLEFSSLFRETLYHPSTDSLALPKVLMHGCISPDFC